MPDPSNTKEYQFYLKKKHIQKLNIVDIKSAIIEHLKTSHKFSKTIEKAEKIYQVSRSETFLYSETEHSEDFLNERSVKINKQLNNYRGYASAYNANFFNFFNSDLQLKDGESTIQKKLIDLLFLLRGFKLITALVLEFKKTGK